MEIRKTTITIRELCAGYVNDTETDIERGVWAYDGKLCVRPEFQRSLLSLVLLAMPRCPKRFKI